MILKKSCEIKTYFVNKDVNEKDLRMILNFGHTLGHAIENISGYGSNYIHGEAISIGMVYASVLSVNHSGLAQNEADRIKTLLSYQFLYLGYRILHMKQGRQAEGSH